MRPKGKLFALVVLFAAVGLLTATGAFTTVEADRTANVGVTGDSSALLQIEPANNSEFATTNNNEVEINLNSSATSNSPDGVNTNATTLDDNVLNITNNGDENIYLQIEAPTDNGEVAFYNATQGNGWDGSVSSAASLDSQGVSLSNAADVNLGNRYLLNSSSTGIQVNSGETVMVGIYIDTNGLSSSDSIFQGEISITAESTDV